MRAIKIDQLLPADLKPGENVLWHGRPQWFSMVRRAYRADYVAAYFGVMTVWNAGLAYSETGVLAAVIAAAKTLGAGALGLAVLALLAWLTCRTTLYVLTTKRVVMKIGIALPIFFNFPYTSITSAAMRLYRDGTGDIPLVLGGAAHIAYLHLWPHARPFRLAKPEPSLRSIPDAAKIADILSHAMVASANELNVKAAAAPAKGMRPARAPEVSPAYPQGAPAAA